MVRSTLSIALPRPSAGPGDLVTFSRAAVACPIAIGLAIFEGFAMTSRRSSGVDPCGDIMSQGLLAVSAALGILLLAARQLR